MTDEQIRAEAESRYSQVFLAGHGMGVVIFEEGAKWHRDHSGWVDRTCKGYECVHYLTWKRIR